MASGCQPLVWRVLRRNVRHRVGAGLVGNGRESVSFWYATAELISIAIVKTLERALLIYHTNGWLCAAVCGPPKYSEIRINFAQSFNAIGTVVGPVLGSYAFFNDTSDSVKSLKQVQWVYLAIAIFVFILAFVFFISNIPEVTDADMQFQIAETHVGDDSKPFWKQYRLFHAAFAQFLYTGAQGSCHSLLRAFLYPCSDEKETCVVAIAGYFINYATETRKGTSSSTGSKMLAGAQGAFAVGRFSGTFFMKFARPRWVFLMYLTAVIVFLAAASGAREDAGVGKLYPSPFSQSFPMGCNTPNRSQRCFSWFSSSSRCASRRSWR